MAVGPTDQEAWIPKTGEERQCPHPGRRARERDSRRSWSSASLRAGLGPVVHRSGLPTGKPGEVIGEPVLVAVMMISRIGPCRVFRQGSREPSARRRLSSEVRRRALRRSSAPAWFSSRLSEISRCTICARFSSPISRVSRWDLSVSICPTSPLFRWRWRSYPPTFPGDDPCIRVTTGRFFATDIARVPVPKLGSSFQACVIGKSVWRPGRPAPPTKTPSAASAHEPIIRRMVARGCQANGRSAELAGFGFEEPNAGYRRFKTTANSTSEGMRASAARCECLLFNPGTELAKRFNARASAPNQA